MFLHTDFLWTRLRVKGSLRSLNNSNDITNNKIQLSVFVYLVSIHIKFKQQLCYCHFGSFDIFSNNFRLDMLNYRQSDYKTIRVCKSCEAC